MRIKEIETQVAGETHWTRLKQVEHVHPNGGKDGFFKLTPSILAALKIHQALN